MRTTSRPHPHRLTPVTSEAGRDCRSGNPWAWPSASCRRELVRQHEWPLLQERKGGREGGREGGSEGGREGEEGKREAQYILCIYALNEQDMFHCPKHTACVHKSQPLKSGHLTILNQDTFFCPKGVRIREVLLYTSMTVHVRPCSGLVNLKTWLLPRMIREPVLSSSGSVMSRPLTNV